MTEQERVKKLEEILADQEFVKKLLGIETAEEVQQALKEKGVELSLEEINEIHRQIIQQLESGEELDKEQLKNVAGGCGVLLSAISLGVKALCTGAGITAAASGISLTDKLTRGRW